MGMAERILEAADARFRDYGYAKTTMAEIARDAGVSVGGVYRFYPGKEALLVASVARALEEKLAAGLDAAARERDAFAALGAFLRARLCTGHAQVAKTRHFYELIRLVNERHQDLLLAYERRVIAAIADILRRGVRAGRFALDDPDEAAYDIHQATLRYNSPLALRRNELRRLEEDLARFLALLDRGLRPRHSADEGGGR